MKICVAMPPPRIGSAILAVAFPLPKRALHSRGGRSKQRPYNTWKSQESIAWRQESAFARIEAAKIGAVFACLNHDVCVVCAGTLERENEMAYVVADPCIGTKDRACVEVCPVACFYENEDQLFIHPQECIDCNACVPVCPVTAIFAEADVPEQWKSYTQKAIDYFAENAGVPAAKNRAEVGSGGVAEGSTHRVWEARPATAAAAAATAVAGW